MQPDLYCWVSLLTFDPQFRDFGVRSADNLDWADDGKIYVNEDRSTFVRVPKDALGCQSLTANEEQQACLNDAFGGRSKVEASIWAVDPQVLLTKSAIDAAENTSQIVRTSDLLRIAVMNRSAQLPNAQIDSEPLDIGNWESSGIVDVTEFFATRPGERLLIGDVQAHNVTDGTIGGSTNLVQGGQLFLLSTKSKTGKKHGDDDDCAYDDHRYDDYPYCNWD